MMNKLEGLSMDIEQNNLDKLRSIFPDCVHEGKLDLDKLLALLGEYDEKEFEKYRFEWNGKAECLRLAQQRSSGTLRPAPEESVNFDTTGNLYIEGDNLEVLKLLQTSYYRKVKMIYIDPPYNTGNDFVYEDDFADPLARYKEVTQQTTKSNPETMGRFHTNWLNMMYPRLRLAANLLRDDGVCFTSIDDNEVDNLKKLCNEVFGEENFIGIIIQNKQNAKNDTVNIQKNHEYIMCYRKTTLFDETGSKIKPTIINRSFKAREVYEEDGKYYYINDSITTRGEGGVLSARPNLGYSVYYNPTTKDKIAVCDYDVSKAQTARDYSELYTFREDLISAGYIAIRPPKVRGQLGVWTWSLDKFNENKQDIIITGKPDAYAVKKRTFVPKEAVEIVDGKHQFVDYSESNVRSIWDFSTNDGTKVLNDIMEESNTFSNAKNLDMIENLVGLIPDNDFIVLDFFAGSGTTAHAVMRLNAEDGGNRKFILVQLPEVTDENSEAYKAGYRNICEIGKERIRRAGAKIQEENDKLKSAPMIETEEEATLLAAAAHARGPKGVEQVNPLFKQANISKDIDTGFKVFKLDTSNLKAWDGTPVANTEQMQLLERMNNMIDNVKADRSDLDMVYEIMLKMGIPMDWTVEPVEINGKTAYAIGENCTLLICLQEGITADDVTAMCDYAPGKMVFAEGCFANDTELANAHYILQDHELDMKLV